MARLAGIRYPDAAWEELQADGQPFALLSQPASSRGGELSMTVQRMADGATWAVVCDGVVLSTSALSAGRAALEAGLEVGLQCLMALPDSLSRHMTTALRET